MTTRQARMARRITQGRHAASPSGVVVEVVVQSAGSRDEHGEWTPGALTSTTMLATSTPLAGEERDVLPEAARLSDARRFWLTSEAEPLRVSQVGPTEGDKIVYDGITWTALRVQRWPGYWQALAIRGERDND